MLRGVSHENHCNRCALGFRPEWKRHQIETNVHKNITLVGWLWLAGMVARLRSATIGIRRTGRMACSRRKWCCAIMIIIIIIVMISLFIKFGVLAWFPRHHYRHYLHCLCVIAVLCCAIVFFACCLRRTEQMASTKMSAIWKKLKPYIPAFWS